MEKRALDAVVDYTRYRMREEGFYRRILPPVQVSNDDLDQQVDTDKPVKIIEREPDSPAAISHRYPKIYEGRGWTSYLPNGYSADLVG